MKKNVLLMLTVVLLFSMVACTPKEDSDKGVGSKTDTNSKEEKKAEEKKEETEDEKKVIGFIPMTMNNEYFITMVNGAKQKADDLGVQLDVQAADQHASAAAQLTIIENMITSGVDGICIVPSSSEGLEAALIKCKEAGIPVINLDTIINKDILESVGMDVPFYGTNNYLGAKLAGEYVTENLEKGIKTAILTGIEGQQNAADRRNGFVDGAGDHIEIVAEQSANWEVDQGYTATQNILSANPDIKLIFASNDGMAIGAVRAVAEVGKQADIVIIGFDAISEALNMVESGELFGTVAQYPAEMGSLGVENIVKVLNGENAEKFIDTGTKIIIKGNVAEHKEYSSKFAE